MCRMQFVHKKDGSWGRKSFVLTLKVNVSLDELSSEEENDVGTLDLSNGSNSNFLKIDLLGLKI